MLPQHIYACNFVEITLVCPTKAIIMKLKCNLLSRMWQHDFLMKQIFLVRYFHQKTKANWLSRLATRVTIPDTHGINMLCFRSQLKIQYEMSSSEWADRFRDVGFELKRITQNVNYVALETLQTMLGVNFTNILRAAFALIFLHRKKYKPKI
jgi:hypothetical protein